MPSNERGEKCKSSRVKTVVWRCHRPVSHWQNKSYCYGSAGEDSTLTRMDSNMDICVHIPPCLKYTRLPITPSESVLTAFSAFQYVAIVTSFLFSIHLFLQYGSYLRKRNRIVCYLFQNRKLRLCLKNNRNK